MKLLIFVKYYGFMAVFGQINRQKAEKFLSARGKAVPLRADYYQSNSLLGNAVWNLAVPHGVVRAIN